jgi:hypothetical protein
MGYRKCLEAAGAVILASKSTFDYQGMRIFKVRFRDHEGWIMVSYGSCGGCDNYEAWLESFPFGYEPSEGDEADFGMEYLKDGLLTSKEVLDMLSESRYEDAEELMEFVNEHA